MAARSFRCFYGALFPSKSTHFEFDKPEAARNKTADSIIVLKFIPQGDGAILHNVPRIGSIRDRDEALADSLARKPLR